MKSAVQEASRRGAGTSQVCSALRARLQAVKRGEAEGKERRQVTDHAGAYGPGQGLGICSQDGWKP